MATQKSQLGSITVNIVCPESWTPAQLSSFVGRLRQEHGLYPVLVRIVEKPSDSEGLEKSTTASPKESMGYSVSSAVRQDCPNYPKPCRQGGCYGQCEC